MGGRDLSETLRSRHLSVSSDLSVETRDRLFTRSLSRHGRREDERPGLRVRASARSGAGILAHAADALHLEGTVGRHTRWRQLGALHGFAGFRHAAVRQPGVPCPGLRQWLRRHDAATVVARHRVADAFAVRLAGKGIRCPLHREVDAVEHRRAGDLRRNLRAHRRAGCRRRGGRSRRAGRLRRGAAVAARCLRDGGEHEAGREQSKSASSHGGSVSLCGLRKEVGNEKHEGRSQTASNSAAAFREDTCGLAKGPGEGRPRTPHEGDGAEGGGLHERPHEQLLSTVLDSDRHRGQ